MNTLNTGHLNEDTSLKAKKIKDEYIDGLPINIKSKFSKLNLAIIDEAVEQIVEKIARINDKVPETKDECFIYISNHQIAALAGLTGLRKATLELNHGQNVRVNLNYRNQTFEFDLKP
jgi:hypothetical protein